jgi:hypothetical protein
MDSAINLLRRTAGPALAWAALTLALTLGVIALATGESGAATRTATSSEATVLHADSNGPSPAVAYLLVGVVGTGAAFTGRRVQIRRFD